MTEAIIRPATPADASAIAQVRIDAWRTTYKGMIQDAYLAAMKVEDSTALWKKILSAGLIVWAIAANKAARAFYEKLGAELLVEQPFTWDGMALVEAGYGWRNLDSLVAAVDLPAVLH